MSRVYYIRDARGERELTEADLPLAVGGEGRGDGGARCSLDPGNAGGGEPLPAVALQAQAHTAHRQAGPRLRGRGRMRGGAGSEDPQTTTARR